LTETAIIIAQTNNWIKSVVIGCNFCPFAAKAMLRKSIHYIVLSDVTPETAIEKCLEALQYLDIHQEIETTFIVFANNFTIFEQYLNLVADAEALVKANGYRGVYQIASFHPNYRFGRARRNDPTNFTNRSIYPMLHILREDSITKVLQHFPDPEGIPARNIAFAKEKGLEYMQLLRAACMEV
jgi:uncharacterized protein